MEAATRGYGSLSIFESSRSIRFYRAVWNTKSVFRSLSPACCVNLVAAEEAWLTGAPDSPNVMPQRKWICWSSFKYIQDKVVKIYSSLPLLPSFLHASYPPFLASLLLFLPPDFLNLPPSLPPSHLTTIGRVVTMLR